MPTVANTTAKHAPTPWRVGLDDGGHVAVASSNGRHVTGFMEREDAAFIVSAVNSHDALVTAAKRALNILRANGESVRPANVLGALTAAIALAEGK